MNKTTWGEGADYPKVYQYLDSFAPKILLDKQIVKAICSYIDFSKDGCVRVAEIGAGPAPISRILTKEFGQKFYCHAFDKNPAMAKISDLNIPYDQNFDLTDPSISEELIGKFDVVILENVLYTTTKPCNGQDFSRKEAEIYRTISLKKVASMLKAGGILVISEPLILTTNFGIRRLKQFIETDRSAMEQLGMKPDSLIGILIKRLFDADTHKIININRGIMKGSVLLTENEFVEFIHSTNLFENDPIQFDAKSYLGSNLTAVYSRNNQPIITDGPSELGYPTILTGEVHEQLLNLIAQFRRQRYCETNATTKLPGVDRYDKSKNGLLVVYHSRNKVSFSATVSFLESGSNGLDASNYMRPNQGNFYDKLLHQLSVQSLSIRKRIQTDGEIKIGEIRRLATDNLGPNGFRELSKSLAQIFIEYARGRNIDVILYVSNPKQATAFNKAIGIVEFKPIEGFALNREDVAVQTIMIPAYKYFFTNWQTQLTTGEIELLDKLAKRIDHMNNWTDVIINLSERDRYIEAVHNLFDRTEDNVQLYFTDYLLHDEEY